MLLLLVVVFFAASHAYAEEGPKCQAPDGGGLQPVLAEFASMVPTDEIMVLIMNKLSHCKQTQAVFEYLKSNDFRQIVEMVQNQPAFKSLIQEFCVELYFDVAYYFNQLGAVFGLPEVHSDMPEGPGPGHGMGFKKLLLDILATIPVDVMEALLEEKLVTDSYLQMAFRKINSDEFGTIIEALQANAAYTDMKDRLRAIYVDVDHIIDALSKIFRREILEALL